MALTFVDKIYTELERKILKGELQPNDRIPSLEQISQTFGVSQGAVRYAIKRLVNRGMLYPIHGKGTFVSSNSSMSSGKKLSNIGLLVMEREHQSDRRFSGILRGIEREAHYRGYQLIYSEINEDDAKGLQRRIQVLNENPLFGMVHIGLIKEEIVPLLKQINCPLVLTGDLAGKCIIQDIDTVTNSQYVESIRIVDHLTALGHRRIGFITCFDEFGWGLVVRDGLLSGLSSHGLTLDREYDISLSFCNRHESYQSGIKMGKTIAEKIDSAPTAFFSADETFAIGMIESLTNLGISVPGQISICTYATPAWEDIIIRGNYKLSGIAMPWDLIGHMAVKRLTELREPGTRVGRYTISGEWIEGTTVGPVRKKLP